MILRRLVLCTLVAACTTFGPVGLLKVQANEPTASPVVIGEIAWAGSTLSTADEWIELWNLSDSPISLAGWSLTGAGENGKTIFFSSTSTIPGSGTFIIANYSSNDAKSALAVMPNVVTTTISLSNASQQIELRDVAGNLVDKAGDSSAPFAGASLPVKTSMVRINNDVPGSLGEAWENASLSLNLKAGVTDLATPGVCDLCSTVQTQEPEAEEPAVAPTVLPDASPTDSSGADPNSANLTESAVTPAVEPTNQTVSEPTAAPIADSNVTPVQESTAVPSTDTSASTVEDIKESIATSNTTSDDTIPAAITATEPVSYEPNNMQPANSIPPEVPTGTSSEASPVPAVSTQSTPDSVPSLPPEQTQGSGTTETSENSAAAVPAALLDQIADPDSVLTANSQASDAKDATSTETTSENDDAVTASTSPSALTDLSSQTSSTQAAEETTANTTAAASTTATTFATTSATTAATSDPMPEETAVAAQPNYALLRLNEIMPNPVSGKEWVEIVSLDTGNTISLTGCTLHDAQGRILTISGITLDPVTTTHVAVELSSARLNNTGDSVSLYSPEGELLDSISYEDSVKGDSWARHPDKTGEWQFTLAPTPGAPNTLVQETPDVESVATTVSSTSSATSSPSTTVSTTVRTTTVSTTVSMDNPATTVVLPTSPAATTVVTPPKTTTSTSTKTTTTKPKTTTTNPKTTTNKSATSTKFVVPLPTPAQIKAINSISSKTSTAKKTTTTAKKTAVKLILPIAFDMRLSDEYSGVQVQLRGTVGSPPGLLTGNSFVLLAPDGQGIKVNVPTSKKLPALGSNLAVTGYLKFNNQGYPSLQMGAKDSWTVLGTATSNVSPRLVDLISLNEEDAWSLINVTGTVKLVKDQTVTLDLGDAEISLVIRPGVDYRAKRLMVGDTVAVKGVLEITSQNLPRILPRASDEIILISHAEPKLVSSSQTSTSVPNWLPLGAAAGAVVVTEGAKQIHRRRKFRLLEKKISEQSALEKEMV